MAYILNLTLACWLTDFPGVATQPYGEYCAIDGFYKTLPELVDYWNSKPNEWPDCIHYPCISEHFEVHETLPNDWKKVGG